MKILEHETKWHTTRLTTIEDDILQVISWQSVIRIKSAVRI